MECNIRRATLDDLNTLKSLWSHAGFSVSDLERRLTEFQMAETSDGTILGAIGFQTVGKHGLLHHEVFADFSKADALRPMFWKRAQMITNNRGIWRVWLRENSPSWSQFGFQPATGDVLKKLPEAWDRTAPGWVTAQIKDEDAIDALEKKMTMLMAVEKRRATRLVENTKIVRVIVTVFGLLVAFAIMGAALWLYLARHSAAAGAP